jgi:hypothetical protein
VQKINSEAAALQGSGWVVGFAACKIPYIHFVSLVIGWLFQSMLIFAGFVWFFSPTSALAVAWSGQGVEEACGWNHCKSGRIWKDIQGEIHLTMIIPISNFSLIDPKLQPHSC